MGPADLRRGRFRSSAGEAGPARLFTPAAGGGRRPSRWSDRGDQAPLHASSSNLSVHSRPQLSRSSSLFRRQSTLSSVHSSHAGFSSHFPSSHPVAPSPVGGGGGGEGGAGASSSSLRASSSLLYPPPTRTPSLLPPLEAPSGGGGGGGGASKGFASTPHPRMWHGAAPARPEYPAPLSSLPVPLPLSRGGAWGGTMSLGGGGGGGGGGGFGNTYRNFGGVPANMMMMMMGGGGGGPDEGNMNHLADILFSATTAATANALLFNGTYSGAGMGEWGGPFGNTFSTSFSPGMGGGLGATHLMGQTFGSGGVGAHSSGMGNLGGTMSSAGMTMTMGGGGGGNWYGNANGTMSGGGNGELGGGGPWFTLEVVPMRLSNHTGAWTVQLLSREEFETISEACAAFPDIFVRPCGEGWHGAGTLSESSLESTVFCSTPRGSFSILPGGGGAGVGAGSSSTSSSRLGVAGGGGGWRGAASAPFPPSSATAGPVAGDGGLGRSPTSPFPPSGSLSVTTSTVGGKGGSSLSSSAAGGSNVSGAGNATVGGGGGAAAASHRLAASRYPLPAPPIAVLSTLPGTAPTAPSALHRGCYRCNELFVEGLLRRGADTMINTGITDPAISSFCWTPLLCAVNNPNRDPEFIVSVLLACGANPTIPDESGCCPLYYAIYHQYTGATRALLERTPSFLSTPSPTSAASATTTTTTTTWDCSPWTKPLLLAIGAHHFHARELENRLLATTIPKASLIEAVAAHCHDYILVRLAVDILQDKLNGIVKVDGERDAGEVLKEAVRWSEKGKERRQTVMVAKATERMVEMDGAGGATDEREGGGRSRRGSWFARDGRVKSSPRRHYYQLTSSSSSSSPSAGPSTWQLASGKPTDGEEPPAYYAAPSSASSSHRRSRRGPLSPASMVGEMISPFGPPRRKSSLSARRKRREGNDEEAGGNPRRGSQRRGPRGKGGRKGQTAEGEEEDDEEEDEKECTLCGIGDADGGERDGGPFRKTMKRSHRRCTREEVSSPFLPPPSPQADDEEDEDEEDEKDEEDEEDDEEDEEDEDEGMHEAQVQPLISHSILGYRSQSLSPESKSTLPIPSTSITLMMGNTGNLSADRREDVPHDGNGEGGAPMARRHTVDSPPPSIPGAASSSASTLASPLGSDSVKTLAIGRQQRSSSSAPSSGASSAPSSGASSAPSSPPSSSIPSLHSSPTVGQPSSLSSSEGWHGAGTLSESSLESTVFCSTPRGSFSILPGGGGAGVGAGSSSTSSSRLGVAGGGGGWRGAASAPFPPSSATAGPVAGDGGLGRSPTSPFPPSGSLSVTTSTVGGKGGSSLSSSAAGGSNVSGAGNATVGGGGGAAAASHRLAASRYPLPAPPIAVLSTLPGTAPTAPSALHRGCYRCNELFVEGLLRRGADTMINTGITDPAISSFCWTPLLCAVNNPNRDPEFIVSVLLACGANPTIPDESGCCPLYYAIYHQYTGATRALLERTPSFLSTPSPTSAASATTTTTTTTWDCSPWTKPLLLAIGAHHFHARELENRLLATTIPKASLIEAVAAHCHDYILVRLAVDILQDKLNGIVKVDGERDAGEVLKEAVRWSEKGKERRQTVMVAKATERMVEMDGAGGATDEREGGGRSRRGSWFARDGRVKSSPRRHYYQLTSSSSSSSPSAGPSTWQLASGKPTDGEEPPAYYAAPSSASSSHRRSRRGPLSPASMVGEMISPFGPPRRKSSLSARRKRREGNDEEAGGNPRRGSQRRGPRGKGGRKGQTAEGEEEDDEEEDEKECTLCGIGDADGGERDGGPFRKTMKRSHRRCTREEVSSPFLPPPSPQADDEEDEDEEDEKDEEDEEDDEEDEEDEDEGMHEAQVQPLISHSILGYRSQSLSPESKSTLPIPSTSITLMMGNTGNLSADRREDVPHDGNGEGGAPMARRHTVDSPPPSIPGAASSSASTLASPLGSDSVKTLAIGRQQRSSSSAPSSGASSAPSSGASSAPSSPPSSSIPSLHSSPTVGQPSSLSSSEGWHGAGTLSESSLESTVFCSTPRGSFSILPGGGGAGVGAGSSSTSSSRLGVAGGGGGWRGAASAPFPPSSARRPPPLPPSIGGVIDATNSLWKAYFVVGRTR